MVQKIQLTNGCLRQCKFCFGHNNGNIECFDMPEIIDKEIEIIDQSILDNPNAKKHIINLTGKGLKINLVQGVDYRKMDHEMAELLFKAKIKPLRFAWDWTYLSQFKKIAKFKNMLLKIGYKPRDLQIFMLINWKIPISECLLKLETLKYWNIQVSQCHFRKPKDQQKIPHYWGIDDLKKINKLCRKHNQLCRYNGYDPEYTK